MECTCFDSNLNHFKIHQRSSRCSCNGTLKRLLVVLDLYVNSNVYFSFYFLANNITNSIFLFVYFPLVTFPLSSYTLKNIPFFFFSSLFFIWIHLQTVLNSEPIIKCNGENYCSICTLTNRKLHVHKIRTWIHFNGWLNLNREKPINFKSIFEKFHINIHMMLSCHCTCTYTYSRICI